MSLSLFKYSGNKGRLLPKYRPPPKKCKRIVEPYLGSGAYSLNHSLPALGFDTNPMVIDLWTWLQGVKEEDLRKLHARFQELRVPENQNLDIRTIEGLSRGELLYLKVCACSLMSGQWSSWGLYPIHNLPLGKTLRALEASRKIEVRLGDASQYVPEEGDVVFLDPPYVGTKANYSGEDQYNPKETLKLLKRINVPVLFTYGDSAEELFPNLPWEVIAVQSVPNLRQGGNTDRHEYVAYLNWPEEDLPEDIFSLFGVGG